MELLSIEFKIPATENLKEDVETMCNLSEGIEQEGIRKGMKSGDLSRAIKVAKEMIKDGMSIEVIKRYTDLSAEDIKQLPSQYFE